MVTGYKISSSPLGCVVCKFHPLTGDYYFFFHIEFGVRETSRVSTLASISSSSSLSRRPAIYRTCGSSPKYRKEPPPAVVVQGPHVHTTTTRQRDAECRIGSTLSISPDIPVSAAAVAVHKLPYRSPFKSCIPHSSSCAMITSSSRGWLENVTLSLLIDQEGFRTVQPLFKPAGLSRSHHLLESGNNKVDVVTFVPTTKAVFRFHYAPLDGLPILRRLMINGDESRDFLSRQAYLSLKSSGMYTVHGTEMASPTVMTMLAPPSPTLNDHAQGLDFAKLDWRFDYSVEDRRAEQTGKVVDGEKILVPHTFTCSPHMLHPSQGKKVKLIQIVKKTVAPKLTAERRPMRTLNTTAAASRLTVPLSPPRKGNVKQAWNLHRRSQSNPRETVPSQDSSSPKCSIRHDDTMAAPVLVLPPPLQRRRRASSVDIQTRIGGGISPIRHIISPSRLCQLFEEKETSTWEHDREMSKQWIQREEEPDFFPLKPSPRFIRN